MLSRKAKRAVRAFEKAIEELAFDGSIPYHSDDDEEQAELDSVHLALEHNYVKARAKLERLLEEKELQP